MFASLRTNYRASLMIDIMIRAETRARLRAFLVNRGLLSQDEQGNWALAPNVEIDEIGNAEVSPGVLDDWWSANLRISGTRADDDDDDPIEAEPSPYKFVRSKFVKFIRNQATQVITPWGGPAYEFGNTPNRIQVLDPRHPGHAPKREWAGGMSL
jgi:hypothetical protein